jgi:hypothetical protein
MWKVTNCRTMLLSGRQSLKYLIALTVGRKSVPGACNAMLIGAFHLKMRQKP